VWVSGTYGQNHEAGITINGSSGSPCWIIGLNTATCTQKCEFDGTYFIIDGLNGDWANSSGNGKFIIGGSYACIRNAELQGDTGTGVGGLFPWGDHVVIYNNYLHHFGDVNSAEDQDNHGIAIGDTTSYVWIIQNEISYCSGDGVQINAGSQANLATVHHIYLGKNVSHHNKQTGMWTKQAIDVIFSQNTCYAHRSGNSSDGGGMGAQYGPDYVWFLFNHIYDCESGVRWQSDSGLGVAAPHSYVIGNLIHNIVVGTGDFDPVNPHSTAGVSFRGSQYRYIVNNVIWDYTGGIYCADTDGVCHVENNILGARTDAAARDIYLNNDNAAPGNASNVKNNVCPASGRYQAGNATVHTSLSAFDAAVATVSGNYEESPDFVSASDFHLQAGSPAIDHGLAPASLSVNVYDVFYQRYGISIERDIEDAARTGTWEIGPYVY
jgi:hypothetical protein